ncbi:MAG: MCE family protein [Bacteroidetes Order II. Incertae sedis bacterium]|nr:MCE family protein [Bacteroidetes Order II. bacterium]
MKHANELKVGLMVIVFSVLGFIGFRFMQNLPAVGGTYELVTSFKAADGIIVSTPVKIRGIVIGKVSALEFKDDKSEVVVRMQIDKEVTIPKDSKVVLEGIDGVGGIRLEVLPGSPQAEILKDGGYVTPIQKPEMIASLAGKANGIVSKLDSVMLAANYRMDDVGRMMNDPNGAVNTTVGNANEMILSLTATIQALKGIVSAQQVAIENIMRNAEVATRSANSAVNNVNNLTADARRFTNTQTDSLARALQNMNRVLETTKETIAGLQVTTHNLNTITGQIATGNGSVGRLLNDQSQLYNRIDSLTIKLNEVMFDLKKNPRKYLRGVVRVF